VLRRLRPDGDLDVFAAICADPEVMRHIAGGRTLTRDETADLLRDIDRHWSRHGFGLWGVEEDGELRGFAGLAVPSFLPAILPAVEVGWRLAREAWGRGLATEAARASLDWGRRELGLRHVVSVISPGNERSVRVAEKLGMARGADRLHPGTGGRVMVFERVLPPWPVH
jgi:RimJ/RimL family protein N-acetyltransferase